MFGSFFKVILKNLYNNECHGTETYLVALWNMNQFKKHLAS